MKKSLFIDNIGAVDFYAGAVRIELVTYEDISLAGNKPPRTAACGQLILSMEGYQRMVQRMNEFAAKLKEHGLWLAEESPNTVEANSPNFPDAK